MTDKETSAILQTAVGKTITTIEPLLGTHWDGKTIEYGVTVAFTDGSSLALWGDSRQSEGYLEAEWTSTVHGEGAPANGPEGPLADSVAVEGTSRIPSAKP